MNPYGIESFVHFTECYTECLYGRVCTVGCMHNMSLWLAYFNIYCFFYYLCVKHTLAGNGNIRFIISYEVAVYFVV